MAIKLVDTSARFWIISEFDDALLSETPEELVELVKTNGETRFLKYSKTLDESNLKFVEGKQPTYFQHRALTEKERIGIQEQYFKVSTADGKSKIEITDKAQYLRDQALKTCLGVRNPDGSVTPVDFDNVFQGDQHLLSLGTTVALITMVGLHLKNA